MAVDRQKPDFSNAFNFVYQITEDMSGWSSTAIHVIAPLGGAILVYGSNDAGAGQSVTYGNAKLATNFTPVQVTNLATGAATSSISAAGAYRYDVNTQFLRLQGAPASAGTNVYRLLLFHSKVD